MGGTCASVHDATGWVLSESAHIYILDKWSL
uniref:Uncharacterized protein n=1 Tax=Arundo donax TaxID=35708 RepID=A0A0A9H864_ARUDO